MLGACTKSFGTTRKNVGNLPPVVRSVRVADGETEARPAVLKSPALEITPWLVEAPITPAMLEFETNCRPTVRASEAESCVSPWTILKFVLNWRLYWAAANFDQEICSCPRNAAGPVNGPANPSDGPLQLIAEIAVAPVVPAGCAIAAAAIAAATTATSARTVAAFFIESLP